jgi:hypothetical protein
MKTLLLAAALLASTPAFASEVLNITKTDFDKAFLGIVVDALKAGVTQTTECGKGYCVSSVSMGYPDRDIISATAMNIKYNNGTHMHVVCTGKTIEDRGCYNASGAFWKEHYSDQGVWVKTQSFDTRFED